MKKIAIFAVAIFLIACENSSTSSQPTENVIDSTAVVDSTVNPIDSTAAPSDK